MEQPNSRWQVGAFNRETNEWDKTWLESYGADGEIDPDMFVRQAPAMRISPSRRKPSEHEWDEVVTGIGDLHYPFHNQTRVELAQVALKETSPDTIVLMGDNLDNAMFSRFETRAEWHESTQKGIDQYAELLAQLRADHPQARILWHEGNHDQRTEKAVRNYNGELLGLKRAGDKLGVLTLEFLLRCDELGVEFIGGYPSSKETHSGALDTYHGSRTASAGLAASRVILGATTSFMTGHTHQVGVVSKTFDMRGEETTIYGGEAGTFADPNLIPSGKYAPNTRQQHDWQSCTMDWYLSDGNAYPQINPITNEHVVINGKRYSS